MKILPVLSRITLLALATLAALPLAAQPKAKGKGKGGKPALPEGVEVIRDIVFCERDEGVLTLDLYRPKDRQDDLPVVIWIHGGGWLKGSKDRCPGVFLAAEGFAVVSTSYRLASVAPWPAQIDDCYETVRWVRREAEKYGFDSDHIGVWGGSAGGHLAALVGTRPYPGEEETSSRVQAVCDWYGPSDLLTMPPNVVSEKRTLEQVANSNGAKLLGATVRDVPGLARDASAFHQVSGDDPPFLIMHGAEDPRVPLVQSVKLHEALAEAGVGSELVILEEAGHGGAEFRTPEVQATVRDFFSRTLR